MFFFNRFIQRWKIIKKNKMGGLRMILSYPEYSLALPLTLFYSILYSNVLLDPYSFFMLL